MDAVILVGCSTQMDRSVTVFRQRGIPIVAIEAAPMPGVFPVDLDNREATARGARHLASLGHRRVAMVSLPLEPSHERGAITRERELASSGHTATQRILGGRDVFPDLWGVVSAGSFVEEGVIAGRELLSAAVRPTAVIAQSDLLAVGVIRAAEELGISVPEQLSVLGFDGVHLEGLAPYELTTLVQPAVDKGAAAGRAVVALLDGERPPASSFESTLQIGNTTGPVLTDS
jgi:DNA-binding LacI/PurR family transcriptional regulator